MQVTGNREAEKAGYLNAIYNISLNQGLAKYRGRLKEFLTELSKQSSFLFQRALLSAESDFSVQLMIERHTGQAVFLQVAAFARLLRVMRGGGGALGSWCEESGLNASPKAPTPYMFRTR